MAVWLVSRYSEQVRSAQAKAWADWRNGGPPPSDTEWQRLERRLMVGAAAAGTLIALALGIWALRSGPLTALASAAAALLLGLHLACVTDRLPTVALAFMLPLLLGAVFVCTLAPHPGVTMVGIALVTAHGLATWRLLMRNWSRFVARVEERAEQARVMAMLGEQKALAEQAVQQRIRFLATASHDLRQPMHAISLYLDGLAAAPLPEAAHRAAADARLCAHDLNDMFRSLLDLSQLDAHQAVPALRRFAIAPVLARIEKELAPLAAARGTTLKVRACPHQVFSDPAMVERIALNFASNAVRHAAGRRVLVACRRRGDALRLAVYDTGPGIPVERQQLIFEEFQRDAGGGGLGLGLAIVTRLAQTLRLPLTLQSREGHGSMFAVDLPFVQAPRAEMAPAASETVSLRGRRVVVIDDEPAILQAVAYVLEASGCQTVCARSVQAALQALADADRAPDAIVCDYHLGDAGLGDAAIARLREEFNADIPALLVTGHTSDGAAVAAADMLGAPLLHKPLDAAALKAALERLCTH